MFEPKDETRRRINQFEIQYGHNLYYTMSDVDPILWIRWGGWYYKWDGEKWTL